MKAEIAVTELRMDDLHYKPDASASLVTRNRFCYPLGSNESKER
jgi:hypothetical protein